MKNKISTCKYNYYYSSCWYYDFNYIRIPLNNWLGIFILYALFPYLVSKIAKEKNRNVFGWTIISILTNPLIVWIIINAVATNNEGKKSEREKNK